MSKENATITETDLNGHAVTRFVVTDSDRVFSDTSMGRALYLICLTWSLFHLYIASPLPYYLANEFGSVFVLGATKARIVHFTFAVFLTFALYPAFQNSSRVKMPTSDWAFAIIGAASALYLLIFYSGIAQRSGAPLSSDIAVAVAGILLLLEATRRTIGLPLTIVGGCFILYGFVGPSLPSAIAHRGNSLGRMADHLWLSTEGVFGIALGVSSGLIFLFVLFGALLEKAGAGSYFIRVSFALLGHLRGGPAKAAVVSSALTGMISGSALANVMTTGTFTIPLMKKVGFPADKAGAIESSSSINGQLMPPVMGAAAFIMTEFVGISYAEVIKHAFLPAVLSYLGLFYIVHLESVKMRLEPLKRVTPLSHHMWLVYILVIALGGFLASAVIYFLVSLASFFLGGTSGIIIFLLASAAYIGLVYVASSVSDDEAGVTSNFEMIPDIKPTILSGLYHVMPVMVLVWLLVVERYSPALAVFWAIISLLMVMMTQGVLLRFFKGQSQYRQAILRNTRDVLDGFVTGALNMVGIAMALACAGVVVGMVSLTGVAMMMVDLIGILAGDSLILMLLLTAIIAIILGLGLPTTANYVVVATLMAPVIVAVGAQNGLVVPLIAVHLFVFYAGLMSGNTPPVAVDAYAAAALAKADPMKTSFQAFYYSARTMILPFIFITNTELLLIGIENVLHLFGVVAVGTIAMMAFVSASVGFLFVRTRVIERGLLLLASFMLAMPSFWIDLLESPYRTEDPRRILSYVEMQPSDAEIRLWVSGENFSGSDIEKVVVLPLGSSEATATERLRSSAGLEIEQVENEVRVVNVAFDGAAAGSDVKYGWTIDALEVRNERLAKQWVYLPALTMLLIVLVAQWHRSTSKLRTTATIAFRTDTLSRKLGE